LLGIIISEEQLKLDELYIVLVEQPATPVHFLNKKFFLIIVSIFLLNRKKSNKKGIIYILGLAYILIFLYNNFIDWEIDK